MSTETKKPVATEGSQGDVGTVRKNVNLNEDSKTHEHDQASYERLIRNQQGFANK